MAELMLDGLEVPPASGVVALEAWVESPGNRLARVSALDLLHDVVGARIQRKQHARRLGHHVAKVLR